MRRNWKVLFSMAVLALALGAAWSYSRADGSPEGKCEVAGLIFDKDGPCDARCRQASERAAVMLKAVRTALGERMKEQFGEKCPCTAGECSAENCATCAFIKTKVFAPLLREKVAARLNNESIALTHFVRMPDGGLGEVPCTFVKGEACPHCAQELTEATWSKANEMLFVPIAGFVSAVREQVTARVKAGGGATCACGKGECEPENCPLCKQIKATVFDPMLHQRVEARLADPQQKLTHSVRNLDGTTRTVPCTFLRTQPCSICANEMADAVRAKMNEATAQR